MAAHRLEASVALLAVSCGGAANASPDGSVPVEGGIDAAPRASASASPPALEKARPGPTPAPCAVVPAGSFAPGDTKRGSATAAAEVTVASFCMDLTEVTVDAYGVCVEAAVCAEPRRWTSDHVQWARFANWRHREGRGTHPINFVTQDEASNYCAWRGARLPTSEEWEWAARGGDEARTFPWGDAAPDAKRLNACGRECEEGARAKNESFPASHPGDDGWAESAPVGSFPAGAGRWGMLDLAGNVHEWTGSLYHPKGVDPSHAGPRADFYAVHGGGWRDDVLETYSVTSRRSGGITSSSYDLGFRCVVPARP